MITERHFPQSIDALFGIINRGLSGCESVAVQAGHFLLYYDKQENEVFPCISSELSNRRQEPLAKEYGQFPFLSWQLATQALHGLPGLRRHMLVIVNDWQYVPPTADHRDKFFRESPLLPKPYISELARSNGAIHLVVPEVRPNDRPRSQYFRETVLRNQYGRNVQDLIARGALPEGVEVAQGDEGTVCSLVEVMGEKREVYCSSKGANCAGEVAQLIDDVHKLVKCDAFINLVPAVCREFVELGTEIPNRLFGTQIKRVINVALPTSGVHSVADLLTDAQLTVHSF